MNEVNASVLLGNSTILGIRKLLMNLRLGKSAQSSDIEVILSRAITDIAGLLDYVDMLETQLRGLDEKDRGVQSLG